MTGFKVGFNRIFGPVAALFLLGLAAVRPLFARGNQLACSDDITFHILRLAQYDHLFRQGVFFSRWAPDMAFGYGFPLFNFYAPLSYYFAEFFSLIAAGDLNLGIRLTFAFGIIASGVTIYFLANEFFSQPAAFVAAVAYMYAPYQGYDVYFRGNLAESFAWWLMPLSLLFMARLVRTNDWRWAAPTALSFAAVILSHNAFALLFSPLLALFGLWLVLAQQSANDGRWQLAEWIKVASVLGLGLALATFFWLPALIEREFVHTDRLLVPPTFVYWGNFVTLSELFAFPRTVHPDLINPSIPRALGLPQAILAFLSLGLLRRSQVARTQKWLVIFFFAASAVTIFLMTAASTFVWETVPLLEFVQFPWRFLGITALTLAFLCAAGVDAMRPEGTPSSQKPNQQKPAWLAWMLIPVIVCSALYWFDPRYCEGNEAPTVADIIYLESWSNTIGTTAKGEYMPKTADSLPEEPYSAPFSTPDNISLSDVNRTPLRFSAQSNADDPFILTANVFDYPGWTATLNDRSVAIAPSDKYGLITIEVPAGEQTIDIAFRETPLRKRANWVSAIALLGCLALFWQPSRTQPRWAKDSALATYKGLAVPSLIGLALFILLGWVLPRTSSVLMRPRLAELNGQPPVAQFNGGIQLVDYVIDARSMAADGVIGVQVELTAPSQTASDYQVNLRLIDPTQINWVSKDVIHPRLYKNYYESRLWRPDQYAEDLLQIDPIPGTPPGTYQIELVVFDKYSKQIAPATDGRLSVNLGTIEISRPAEPPQPEDFDTQFEAGLEFGFLTLVGYGHDRLEAKSGDPFALSMVWQANGRPKNDEVGILKLVNIAGQTGFEKQVELISPYWPTSNWLEGDIWRGQSTMILPPTLPSGEYRWELCVLERCHKLGPLAIEAPNWLFTRPDVDFDLGSPKLGTLTQLSGASFDQNNPEEVTLVWQPLETPRDNYKVFVHLLNSAGELVAQSDSIPAQNSRPTTGWIPNEFIIDQHQLSIDGELPAGSYSLVTGVYSSNTSARLMTEDGGNSVLITQFEIE